MSTDNPPINTTDPNNPNPLPQPQPQPAAVPAQPLDPMDDENSGDEDDKGVR